MRWIHRSLQLKSQHTVVTCDRRGQALHSATARALPHRQDRISSDGTWWSSPAAAPTSRSAASAATDPQQQQGQGQQQGQVQGQQPYVIGSPTAGDTAPAVPPVSNEAVDRLAEVLQNGRSHVLVLTGAGCSTESNIPDYRGPAGAYTVSSFKPMTHQQFMASEDNRNRYWARSFAGWFKFSRVQPNAAHQSIARLQQNGWAHSLITQNVDRLHHKAGSPQVLELHGTTHQVVCMDCGRLSCREEFQQLLAALNPDAAAAAAQLAAEQDAMDDMDRLMRAGTATPVPPSLRETSSSGSSSSGSSSSGSSSSGSRSSGSGNSGGGAVLLQRPDGDAQVVRRPDGDMEIVGSGRGFRVPPCSSCGGILKPHVVFFGDGIPAERAQHAMDLAHSCRSMLVVGSSLAVWSAFRLAKAAVENGAQLAILTAGPTRADDLAHLKIEGRAGEVLSRLAAHPSLQVPPVY